MSRRIKKSQCQGLYTVNEGIFVFWTLLSRSWVAVHNIAVNVVSKVTVCHGRHVLILVATKVKLEPSKNIVSTPQSI